MPSLGCRQLGGDCDYIAEGMTKADVKREMLAHVADAHRQRASRMSRDEREALEIRIDQVLVREERGARLS